jgi:hypothetical protein
VAVVAVSVTPVRATSLITSRPGRPFCEFATYFSGNSELTGANTFVLYPILPSMDDHVSTAVPFKVSDE